MGLASVRIVLEIEEHDVDAVKKSLVLALHPDRHQGSKSLERLFMSIRAQFENGGAPAAPPIDVRKAAHTLIDQLLGSVG